MSLTLQLWRNQDKSILYPALIYKETEMSYFHPFFYDIRFPLDGYHGHNIVKISTEFKKKKNLFFLSNVVGGFFVSFSKRLGTWRDLD